MGTLEKASPGRENAKDWLTLKIVECLAEPMDEHIASKLNLYNSAYNAVCQWSDDFEQDEYTDESEPHSAQELTIKDAKLWTSKMENSDGTKGPHWTIDQAKQIMAQRNISGSPAQFWVAINMIYSDYCTVIKNAGVSNVDFYANMAKAFLDDKDAQPDKLMRYYEHITK